ncbi:hypothetical protein EST55_11075 [Idiomarina sp. 29L]|uniref:hypothetical protein n=1 Tax=Idiomarina sp. 29L TaxID=2508877 RepID=UPI0010132915|nr:hypothetical protein [Idiomarina sp. 29L]RXS41451.1 hypothetical protein EST55_11075 [Idiomarina sp. 29L]
MNNNNDEDTSNVTLDNRQSVDPWAGPVKETKLLNVFIVIAIGLFAAGHFFNIVEIRMWGQTEAMVIANEMSSGELTFFVFCCLIAIASALTGVLPVAAKVVAVYFLITYGDIFYDISVEASEASDTLSMMGIDLSRSNGWEKLFDYLGVGAYLLIIGFILMFVSLFIRLKTRNLPMRNSFSEGAEVRPKAAAASSRLGGFVSKYIEVVNLHIADIKLALKERDSSDSLSSIKLGTDKTKKSVNDKDFRASGVGIYEVIKGSLAYAFGFIKTVFSENNTGKVLVVLTVIMIYNLIF